MNNLKRKLECIRIKSKNNYENNKETKMENYNKENKLKSKTKMETTEVDIDCLPPFLREYLNSATRVCGASPKALAEAWLPIIAVNIGDRVYIINELKKVFSNLWVGLIGPSGQSRKSTTVNVAKLTMEPFFNSLDAMNEKDRQKSNPIINRVTLTKLESMLKVNNSPLILLEEISILTEMFNNKNNKGMKQELTALYDGGPFNYSSMNNTIEIKDCALSMLFCATQECVQRIFYTEEDRQFGFAQRIFPCIISTENKGKNIAFLSDEESADKLKQLANKLDILRNIPGSFELKLTAEAMVYYQNKLKKIKNSIEQNDALNAWSYGIRIYIQGFLKFCIIFTLMEHIEELKNAELENKCKDFFDTLQVSGETAEQALYLCGVIYNDTKIFMNIVNTSKLSNEAKIVNQLARYPEQWVTRSLILQNTKLPAKEFNNAIKTLTLQEVVMACKKKSSDSYKNTECYILLSDGWDIYNLPNKPNNFPDIKDLPVISPHSVERKKAS